MSCVEIYNYSNPKPVKLNCKKPDYLKRGDKVALISPSFFTPMENVEKTAALLRTWGLEPVIGPNVGKTYDGKYAGTLTERLSDIHWALDDPSIKAIICNRGGYGTIQLINHLKLEELSAHPKWLVGFSDITTLHGLLTRAGVMSIQGTMSSFLAKGGQDSTSTLMRDLLLGNVPLYEVPAHPQNIEGWARGVLVGGNLCGFPAGHDDVNLPLVMGAPVTMEVRSDGASLRFDIEGAQHTVPAVSIAAPASPLSDSLLLSGERAL